MADLHVHTDSRYPALHEEWPLLLHGQLLEREGLHYREPGWHVGRWQKPGMENVALLLSHR